VERYIWKKISGHIGFMFANWGNVPSKEDCQVRVLMRLKNQAAQIISLAEAEELLAETLRQPSSASPAVAVERRTSAARADEGTSAAVADELAARTSCK
jgi:hypothetical protein